MGNAFLIKFMEWPWMLKGVFSTKVVPKAVLLRYLYLFRVKSFVYTEKMVALSDILVSHNHTTTQRAIRAWRLLRPLDLHRTSPI